MSNRFYLDPNSYYYNIDTKVIVSYLNELVDMDSDVDLIIEHARRTNMLELQ